MRLPLSHLSAELIRLGTREGMGVRFLCPEHMGHIIEAWFLNPIDEMDPGTLNEDRQTLYSREGDSVENLSLWPPVEHGLNGEVLIVVFRGIVNVIYL